MTNTAQRMERSGDAQTTDERLISTGGAGEGGGGGGGRGSGCNEDTAYNELHRSFLAPHL